MAIRLQQMHPALVHFPIALLPLSIGADLLGCVTGSTSLHSFGQKAIGAHLAACRQPAAAGAAFREAIGDQAALPGQGQ